MEKPTTTLFYDGLCPLCSREIAHYRKHVGGEPVRFVDITDPTFDPARHRLDRGRIHREMHVAVGEEMRVGVDAFVAIWDAIPVYHWLARLARLPGVYGLLWLAYGVFRRVRVWLPRNKAGCETGTCEI